MNATEQSAPEIPVYPNRYAGKVAVVTAAGSGIGRAIAERLDAEGAVVVANDLTEDGLKTLRGERIHTVVADVADPATPDLIVAKALEVGGGRIDALFNNAGITHFANAEDFPHDAWRRVMSINLDAAFYLASAVGKVMIAQGGGAILNTASVASLFGIPRSVAYTTSKHGTIGLTRALAAEWGPYGIRVNAICPGMTATGMNEQLRHDHPARWAGREAATPLRRGGRPEDQAATALFLNSDEAWYTSGQIAVVDGGAHALHSGYITPFKE